MNSITVFLSAKQRIAADGNGINLTGVQLTILTATMDSELQREVTREVEKQRFQQLSQQLTAACWDKCVTGKLSSSFDSKTRNCILNCVERFIDVSSLVNMKQNQTQLGFTDVSNSGM